MQEGWCSPWSCTHSASSNHPTTVGIRVFNPLVELPFAALPASELACLLAIPSFHVFSIPAPSFQTSRAALPSFGHFINLSLSLGLMLPASPSSCPFHSAPYPDGAACSKKRPTHTPCSCLSRACDVSRKSLGWLALA
jgi:hypothetical protein